MNTIDLTGVPLPLVLPILAATGLWAILGGLTGIAFRGMHPTMRTLAPVTRAWVLQALAFFPLLVAVLVAALVFTPVFHGAHLHAHCHGAACEAHVPMALGQADSAMAYSALAAGLGGLLIGFAVLMIYRGRQVGLVLMALACRSGREEYEIIDSPNVFACCAGLLRQRVLISRGLLTHARAEQLQVALAHEHAHRYRFDNLRQLSARIATVLWWPSLRKALLAELSLAAEQSCDQAAARQGSANLVAQTIVAVRHWQLHALTRGAQFASTGEDTLERLRALARPRWRPVSAALAASMVLTVYAIAVYLLADVSHHLAESVLLWLAG